MSCSSVRGQTEPLAALAAVFAVTIGLSLYAGVLDDALTGPPDRNIADSTLDRIERTVAPTGVAVPTRLDDAMEQAPDGHRLNVTLAADGHVWSAGPVPPNATVDRASARLAVEVTPTVVPPGELRVVTWR